MRKEIDISVGIMLRKYHEGIAPEGIISKG